MLQLWLYIIVLTFQYTNACIPSLFKSDKECDDTSCMVKKQQTKLAAMQTLKCPTKFDALTEGMITTTIIYQ